jgi:hypothetical protein
MSAEIAAAISANRLDAGLPGARNPGGADRSLDREASLASFGLGAQTAGDGVEKRAEQRDVRVLRVQLRLHAIDEIHNVLLVAAREGHRENRVLHGGDGMVYGVDLLTLHESEFEPGAAAGATATAALRLSEGFDEATKRAGKKRAGWSHHSPPNGGSSVTSPRLEARTSKSHAVLVARCVPVHLCKPRARALLAPVQSMLAIATLYELIRIGRDGEDPCAVCGASPSPFVGTVAVKRRGMGRRIDELQALVLLLGGEPARLPSVGARALHLRLAARARLRGPDESLLLKEWQRLEHIALSHHTLTLQTKRTLRRLERMSGLSDHPLAHSPIV